MSAPICFLDTETDGVHPGRKAWEVAAIRREPDGEERTFHAFVDIDLATADPFGLKVGRFYERHPTGRFLAGLAGDDDPRYTIEWSSQPLLTRSEAASGVARITYGAHIVGAVPDFDTEVLARLLRDHGLTPAWHYHLIDVENLAVGYLAGSIDINTMAVADQPASGRALQPPWSSDELTTHLGLTPPPEKERHTALGDARWAMRIYDAVMGAS